MVKTKNSEKHKYMIDLKDVEQFLVWQYLNQKERNYLIKKYDIKTFQRLRELENESIIISMNNLEDWLLWRKIKMISINYCFWIC